MGDARESAALLPCPLCGERVHFEAKGAWRIICGCGLNGPIRRYQDAAIVAWNTRAATDLEAALRDPTIVHLNMLRGGIAKPTPTNIWHLYGDDALIAVMPAAAREKVGNPNHCAAAIRNTDFTKGVEG